MISEEEKSIWQKYEAEYTKLRALNYAPLKASQLACKKIEKDIWGDA